MGVLQIKDQSPQSRSVASRNPSQTQSDATGLNCGDRSWICNEPQATLVMGVAGRCLLPPVKPIVSVGHTDTKCDYQCGKSATGRV